MANIKTNIQTHVEALFEIYPQTVVTNANIAGVAFDASLVLLQQDYSANKLSEEELVLSGVTVERIEVQGFINEGIHATRHAYMTSVGGELTPDWLLKEGLAVDVFAAFFAELSNVSEKTRQHLAIEGLTIESLQALYVQWADLIAKEELNNQAQEKVRSLVDIRRVLVAMVAYKGVPVREVMERVGMKEVIAE